MRSDEVVDSILKEAQSIFDTMEFCSTHPKQIYDYEWNHKMTSMSFNSWWWDVCYREARTRHHLDKELMSQQHKDFLRFNKERV